MVTELVPVGQLAGVGVWTAVALLALLRRTVRGPPLWAFVVFATAFAVYPLLDYLYLAAAAPEEALMWVRGRMVAVGLAVLALALFTRWLLVRRRQADLLFLVPSGALLALAAGGLIVVDVTPTAWGFATVRVMPLYLLWILYLYGYATLGVYYLLAGTRTVREESPILYAGSRLIAVSILGLMVAGFLGNVLFNLLGVEQIPLFSAFLFLPGVVMLTVVAPLTRDRIQDLVRRIVIRNKQVAHAFLVYEGGTLIASRSQEGTPVQDEDLFAAVFEALQRFTAFSMTPFGSGWLDAIDHGDVKILVERGVYTYLVLVTAGREDDLLRLEMREILRGFEVENAQRLRQWGGDARELKRAQESVDFLFEMDRVF